MKAILTVLITLLLAASCLAAEPQQVSYKSGDETVTGLLYLPEKPKGKLAAIVVIHEWWGLNDWVKEQAANLAEQGYAALAVELYRGRVAASRDEAHELSRGLPPDRALRDLRAAVAYLAGRKDVDAKRIGAIGWCMGGGKVAQLIQAEPQVRAAVINYGSVPADPESIAPIQAEVLGIFGAKDRGIPVESVQRFEAELQKQGKKAEFVVYPEAGHAFQNPNNKNGYRAGDAADAWKRIVAFFARALRG